MYGELASAYRPTGRPALPFKDVSKQDMKLTDIYLNTWESFADDSKGWRYALKGGVKRGEVRRKKHSRRAGQGGERGRRLPSHC